MGNYLQQLLDQTPSLPATTLPGLKVLNLAEGVLAIEPENPSFDLCISCGIHGNETAPIELAAKLLQEILDGSLNLQTRVLFIFGNPPAMRCNERYLDDDLNRLFGKSDAQRGEGPAAQRAGELEAVIQSFFAQSDTRFKLHYDLHTAIRGSQIEKFAIYPYPHATGFNQTEMRRLAACGIQAVLLQSKPSPTFSYFSRQHCGAQGFTLELGKARPFGQNQVVNLDQLEGQLRCLLNGEVSQHTEQSLPQQFVVAHELIKHSEAFVLNLATQVENFTELALGLVLTEDGEQRYVVKDAGARIVFPNPKVKPGLRAGLVVVPLVS